jgi:heme-degrading monooxygenase HmoA
VFIAMNRFQVQAGEEERFERVWLERDTHLKGVPGFVEFHLLRGPRSQDGGHTLYASHSVWASRAAFEAWTRSQAFRDAHRGAGDHGGLYLGHPRLETFEALQTVKG